MADTHQMNTWSSDFGKEYTDRNPHTPDQMNELYQKNFGLTRTELNEDFLGSLDREMRILEVGSNVGTQLQALQQMGFKNLYGVELQQYAVELSKKYTKSINIIQGSAFDLPFRDSWFDLVYTSGVLIHIAPQDLPKVYSEMYRCSRQFIWGFEYYAETHRSVSYRDKQDLLWKGDFGGTFAERFPDLKMLKTRMLKYLGAENVDCMYLLEKK